MSRPTIVILHSLLPSSRQTTIDHVLCYLRYLTNVKILYHHIRQPPGRLRKAGVIDLVVVNYCFLAHRTTPDWPAYRELYGFLREFDCPIVALPQDDFGAHRVLDDWLVEIGVDEVWSPIEENLEVLYPRSIRNASFRRQLTGYVDTRRLSSLRERARPLSERPIDVGTRVRLSAPNLGRYAQLKGIQALGLRDGLRGTGFRVDISTEAEDAILGERWFKFLESCRFTVGRKGGASVPDPDYSIALRTREYLTAHPDATFDQVEAACFPGLDGRHVFTAVSPRMFEAAASQTCQILAPDDYLGVLEPWVHYIPLEPDFSNLDEVIEAIHDLERAEEITNACYDALIASGRFAYETFAREVTARVSADAEPGGAAPAERVSDPLTDSLMELPAGFGVDMLETLRRLMKPLKRRGLLSDLRLAVEIAARDRKSGLEPFPPRMAVEVPGLANAGHLGPVALEFAAVAADIGASDAVLAWVEAAVADHVEFRESLRWTDPVAFEMQDAGRRAHWMEG